MVRPLLWWMASNAVCTWLYLQEHLARATSSGSCLVGPSEPWVAALGLSLRKGLLFIGLDSTDKLNQIYACLYDVFTEPGTKIEPGGLTAGFIPVIPDSIAFLSIVQLLLSAVLIFLFLLAVRNHFRIK